MGLRTFQRRFTAITGTPPGEWLVAERLRLAPDLLEHPGRVSLDDIAEASGFGTQARLRHHFRARLGTSPAAYRRRFAASEMEAASEPGHRQAATMSASRDA